MNQHWYFRQFYARLWCLTLKHISGSAFSFAILLTAWNNTTFGIHMVKAQNRLAFNLMITCDFVTLKVGVKGTSSAIQTNDKCNTYPFWHQIKKTTHKQLSENSSSMRVKNECLKQDQFFYQYILENSIFACGEKRTFYHGWRWQFVFKWQYGWFYSILTMKCSVMFI